VAPALLVQALKSTLGHPLEIQTPHQVQSILDIKGHQYLTGGTLLKYQVLHLETPEVTLKPCNILNQATFLPLPDGELMHSCLETIDQVYSS
jgi:hypothetical protein